MSLGLTCISHLKKFCLDRKSTRLNSSHSQISYAAFCLKKKRQVRVVLDSDAHGAGALRVERHFYAHSTPDDSINTGGNDVARNGVSVVQDSLSFSLNND